MVTGVMSKDGGLGGVGVSVKYGSGRWGELGGRQAKRWRGRPAFQFDVNLDHFAFANNRRDARPARRSQAIIDPHFCVTTPRFRAASAYIPYPAELPYHGKE
jgi:hypothetical protein